LYHEMMHSDVINLEGGSKAALVFGQMNEPPGARARVALTALTIAEYFRDVEGQDVVVLSMADVPLGFGVAAKSTAECRKLDPQGIVALHQADIGEYLRDEDSLC